MAYLNLQEYQQSPTTFPYVLSSSSISVLLHVFVTAFMVSLRLLVLIVHGYI
jgi:hypothetical protein